MSKPGNGGDYGENPQAHGEIRLGAGAAGPGPAGPGPALQGRGRGAWRRAPPGRSRCRGGCREPPAVTTRNMQMRRGWQPMGAAAGCGAGALRTGRGGAGLTWPLAHSPAVSSAVASARATKMAAAVAAAGGARGRRSGQRRR